MSIFQRKFVKEISHVEVLEYFSDSNEYHIPSPIILYELANTDGFGDICSITLLVFCIGACLSRG